MTPEQLQREGLTYREIAARLGISYRQVRKALSPGYDEMVRRDNRQRAAAKREWAGEHDRRPCGECGEPLGAGVHRRGVTRCVNCLRDAEERRCRERAEQIAKWWAAGETLNEIAARLGWTKNHLGQEFDRIRRKWPGLLPHRYNVKPRVAA